MSYPWAGALWRQGGRAARDAEASRKAAEEQMGSL